MAYFEVPGGGSRTRMVPAERDKTLAWLHDHAGRHVIVTLGFDVGFDAWVAHFEGRLRHWSDDWQGTGAVAVPRPDVAGWFMVGDASIDLTHLPVRYQVARGELQYDLAPGVTVRVTAASW